jgi:hypothetical protein
VYNATACVSCHENPNSGGASQFTELRVGHKDENGNFVNPTIFINDGKNTIIGRSIVNDRAIGPEAQEHIPATETSAHCVPPSTPWGMDLLKPLTTRL